jgi:two-component system sensor histidine kinase QseC
MITATLVWAAIMGVLRWQITHDADTATEDLARQGAAMVLPLVVALQDRPAELQAALQGLDRFQRSNAAPTAEQPNMQLPRIYVWRDGALVYRSADALDTFTVDTIGRLHERTLAGKPWRIYAEDTADHRVRFAAQIPAGDDALGVQFWSRGFLLLPLLNSLPFLIVPAWISVLLALRPWAKVSREIASRSANDLSPLTYAPRHSELSPLTQAVNQLLGRLRDARERERHFIADAAHELRTPIAAMRVHTEALLGHDLSPQDRELLRGLLASNQRAGRLVEQLLALTRSEAGDGRRESSAVDFEALVQDSLAQQSAVAGARDVELDLEADRGAVVRGDPESLQTLVDNLVSNAIKYSPEGGTVRVRLTVAAGAVRLAVTDEGPGIADDLKSRVFDRFFRAPDQTQPGSGLGLAIAKAVADRHGATLVLADGPGGLGLTVTLSFADQFAVGPGADARDGISEARRSS